MLLTDVTVQCIKCGQAFLIKVPTEGLTQWKEGGLIQDALPTLTDDERDLLIYHLCSECFEEVYTE